EAHLVSRPLDAERQVHDGRGFGLDAAVLDERPRPEVPRPRAAEEPARPADRDARRDAAGARAGDADAVAGTLEPRVGPRELDVEREPLARPIVERDLEPVTAARQARLRAARIADEQELRVELEIPQRRGDVHAAVDEAAEADFEL